MYGGSGSLGGVRAAGSLARGIFYLHRVLSVAPLSPLANYQVASSTCTPGLQRARLLSSGQAHSDRVK
jgi:hypothetical protein